MKFLKYCFCVCIFFFVQNSVYSQTIKVTQDYGLWTGIKLTQAYTDFEFALEPQLRTFYGLTQIDDYIVDLSVEYKINSHFDIGSRHRYNYNNKRHVEAEQNYSYTLDFKFDYSFSFIKLYYRLRYEKEYVNLFTDYSLEKINTINYRNRIKLQYSLSEINNMYISGELFKIHKQFKSPYFNKYRIYAGDEIETKWGTFDCSVGYTRELNDEHPEQFICLNIVYELRL